MSESSVRIVKLGKIHVASVHGFGEGPEQIAWDKMNAWAKPKGYLDDPANHPVFGFNNPNPSPGSPNYGYELWMTVDADEQAAEGVEIKDFDGGLYAVSRCVITGDPEQEIPAAWQKLVLWRENSPYRAASHQWLEEHIPNEGGVETAGGAWMLDLYLPIAE